MKLTYLKLKNFRGYRLETIISFNDFTALIGKNDAGKSTILEALEIFFNNETVCIDRDDLCKDAFDAGETNVEITCVFGELPPSIIIDTTNSTSLNKEYLLNTDGLLEIKKKFSCTSAKPKEQIFLVANHPTNKSCCDLHLLKNDKLKARAKELGVLSDDYNASINSTIREAIWNHIDDLELSPTELPVEKFDSKNIWDELKKWMPTFALFQSDRKSKEDDKEVTDPMKMAISEAIKELQPKLIEIQNAVHEKAIDVANRTLEKLKEMNADLADELTADFKSDPKWSSIFSLTLASDRNIPINKRGSGVRRLIVLNFFRAEAERKRAQSNNPNVIYAFEEPETSQHPDHQTILVEAFKDLSSSSNTQVIITTHTPAIAGLIKNEDLRFVTSSIHKNPIVENGNSEMYEKVANSLGLLPDPLSTKIQLIVCVEGPNDIEFLKNITPLIKVIDPSLPDLLNDQRIAIIPLGGGTLKDWVNHNYLSGLKKPEFHIYDCDDPVAPPYQEYVNSVNARGDNSYAVLTTKREMENYIHHEAINRYFGITLSPINDFDDVPSIIAEALHVKNGGTKPWSALEAESKRKKIGKAKKELNYNAVKMMTDAEYLAIDTNSEILKWFREISNRLS